MLYELLKYLDFYYDFPGSGLYKFISFRAALGIIFSLCFSLLFGGKIIHYLKSLQIGESIRDLGLDGQMAKAGTPTMGGIMIIGSIMIPCVLLADLSNIYIILILLTTTWMGIIGFIDDYIKVFKKDKKGLKAAFKLFGQIGLGCIIGITMIFNRDIVVRITPEEAHAKDLKVMKSVYTTIPFTSDVKEMVYVKSTQTNIPFFKENNFDYKLISDFIGINSPWILWCIFTLISTFIVTSVSNGSNLTDGIDGLAAGVAAIVGVAIGLLTYVSSNTVIADYLNILYIPGSAELVVFCACFIGACIGFLWFNAYPAQIFMGDTGSLTLGGIIAALAIMIRKEFLIPVLCGIFLIESLSVMMQVGYFKYTRKKFGEGRRIFLMSPLHHHYQKMGIHESKIVTRFWILGILLAVLTIVTLKLR